MAGAGPCRCKGVTVYDEALGSGGRVRVYRRNRIHAAPRHRVHPRQVDGSWEASPASTSCRLVSLPLKPSVRSSQVEHRLAPEYTYPVPLDDCDAGVDLGSAPTRSASLWMPRHPAIVGVERRQAILAALRWLNAFLQPG